MSEQNETPNINYFNELNSINVKEKVEIKEIGSTKLKYLSWAWAWQEVKNKHPDASYEIVRYENNLPYILDEKTGYLVTTRLTINNVTHEMWLPVMDGANKAMKAKEYYYKVKDWDRSRREGQSVFKDKLVEAATMFDINKTIMRCLVKNIAMHGLGLYIYAGEDLPSEPEEIKQPVYRPLNPAEIATIQKMIDKVSEIDPDFSIVTMCEALKVKSLAEIKHNRFNNIVSRLTEKLTPEEPKEEPKTEGASNE
jgi:hypothetical protein